MACELTSGLLLNCKDGFAGIQRIWIQQQADFASGVTLDATTLEVDALPEATIYPFEVVKGTGGFAESTSSANGGILHTQTVTLVLNKMTSVKRKQLELLAKNRALVVFVWDKNGKIWMVGRQFGAEITTIEAATGSAAADLNGYTITFVAEEPSAAEQLEAYTAIPFDNFADITIGTSVVD
jgi:streptogramin lyase